MSAYSWIFHYPYVVKDILCDVVSIYYNYTLLLWIYFYFSSFVTMPHALRLLFHVDRPIYGSVWCVALIWSQLSYIRFGLVIAYAWPFTSLTWQYRMFYFCSSFSNTHVRCGILRELCLSLPFMRPNHTSRRWRQRHSLRVRNVCSTFDGSWVISAALRTRYQWFMLRVHLVKDRRRIMRRSFLAKVVIR